MIEVKNYFSKSFGVAERTVVDSTLLLVITNESDLTRAESGTFVESTLELPVPVPVPVSVLPPLDFFGALFAETMKVIMMKNEMQ